MHGIRFFFLEKVVGKPQAYYESTYFSKEGGNWNEIMDGTAG